MSEILLIDPATDEALRQREKTDLLRRLRYFPSLGLMVLANHSPGHEVRILDERLERCDPATIHADLVGITVRTAQAPRAHKLARVFFARNIPVVFGGPYATLTPEFALKDPAVTAVVQGVAEGVWPTVLEDFSHRRLRRRYSGRMSQNVSAPPMHPRPGAYRPATGLVQVIKGCNFRCSFCVIPKLYDSKVVVPQVDSILKSIAQMRQPNLVIVDDNFIADRAFAREFCLGMKGLQKRWTCQATLNLACDKQMMSLMSDAGCGLVNIGLETLDAETWKRQNKQQNFSCEFSSAIARLHDHGLLVSGGFVFGFDEDDSSVFDRTQAFIRRSKLDFAACHVLTPYPGLPLYDEMKRDGRILTDDLSYYNTYDVVYRPARMTPEELQCGFDRLVREFYSFGGILKRYTNAMSTARPFTAAMSALAGVIVNTNLKRRLPIHA